MQYDNVCMRTCIAFSFILLYESSLFKVDCDLWCLGELLHIQRVINGEQWCRILGIMACRPVVWNVPGNSKGGLECVIFFYRVCASVAYWQVEAKALTVFGHASHDCGFQPSFLAWFCPLWFHLVSKNERTAARLSFLWHSWNLGRVTDLNSVPTVFPAVTESLGYRVNLESDYFEGVAIISNKGKHIICYWLSPGAFWIHPHDWKKAESVDWLMRDCYLAGAEICVLATGY